MWKTDEILLTETHLTFIPSFLLTFYIPCFATQPSSHYMTTSIWPDAFFFRVRLGIGKEFTDEDKKEMIPTVHLNVIQSIKILTEKVNEFDVYSKVKNQASFDNVRKLNDFDVITPAIAENIIAVWTDDAVQEVWARRSEYQIIESVKYYFDKLETIGAVDYVPSKDDILYSRVRTSGVVTEKYDIEATPFEMYDVGGQKNERKKWIHCFEDVTAVIFVAAISEYDQNLFEDGATNRMVSSLGETIPPYF